LAKKDLKNDLFHKQIVNSAFFSWTFFSPVDGQILNKNTVINLQPLPIRQWAGFETYKVYLIVKGKQI